MNRLKNYMSKMLTHMNSKRHHCHCPIFVTTRKHAYTVLSEDMYVRVNDPKQFYLIGYIYDRPILSKDFSKK